MSSLITTTYPSAKAEEELRTSIALNRGMEWLKDVKTHEKHRIYRTSASLGHLEELFYETHRQLFQDWNGSNDRVSGENRMKLREALATTLFSKDEHGKPNGLFDENDFALRFSPEDKAQGKFAEKLAAFYEKAREIKPYSYGNKLTLDFFMVALSKLPPVAEVYPDGVDFRHLDEKDLRAMAEPHPEHGAIVTAFKHATDPARTHPLRNNYKPHSENGYRTWGDKTETVGGVPFLSHTENGTKYLVTMNGGLVTLDSIKPQLEEHLKNDGLLSDFQRIKTEKYLAPPEDLSEKLKADLSIKLDNLRHSKSIKGVKIKNGEAPLVCLDINIMSGQRPQEHAELMTFLKRNSDLVSDKSDGRKVSLPSALHDDNYKKGGKTAFLSKLKERAGDDDRLKKILDTAYDWSNANSSHIEKIVKEKLEGKIEQKRPVAYLSMGGSGSGKSIVEKLAKAKFKDDFVISSLDNSREASDMHTLLVAAGHHADDYALVAPFAAELRERTINRAIEKKVNILCDGSGIDYKGRHDRTIKALKEGGYHTNVVSVDSTYQQAVARINNRFEKEDRAMPWNRVADKHVNSPPSFLDAVRDRNVDKVSIIATDRDKGEQYLVAETVDKNKVEVSELNKQKKTGLAETLKKIFLSPLSIVESFKAVDRKKITDISNVPDFNSQNTSFITYPDVRHGDKERVLTVYDTARLTQLMEKGLANQYANSPDPLAIQHTKKELPFYMPKPQDGKEGAWQLHLKGRKKDEEKVMEVG